MRRAVGHDGSKFKRELPNKESSCPCGSGQTFGKCCARLVDGKGPPISEQPYAPATREGLEVSRAALTQYRLWHRWHTQPFVQADPDAAAPMVRIDVDAMSDLVARLMGCYIKNGLSDFPLVLARLRDAIESKRWTQKLEYHRAFWMSFVEEKDDQALTILENLGDHREIDDPAILQLILELQSRSAGFAERVTLIQRIIVLSDSAAVKLRYSINLFLQYAAVGDDTEAISVLKSGIEKHRSHIPLDDVYGQHTLAKALSFLGSADNNPAFVEQSITILQELQSRPDWTPAGQAALLRDEAECFMELQNWDQADALIKRAHELDPIPYDQVLRAQSALGHRDYTLCLEVTKPEVWNEMPAANLFDLLEIRARCLVMSNRQDFMEETITALRAARPSEPSLKERADARIMEMLARLRGTEITRSSNKPRLFGRLLRPISEFLILEPSVFGFGVNVNAILSRMSDQKDRKE